MAAAEQVACWRNEEMKNGLKEVEVSWKVEKDGTKREREREREKRTNVK
jgi:hypothetical protein